MLCSEQYFFLLEVTLKLMLYGILIAKIGIIVVHNNSILLIKLGKCHIYITKQLELFDNVLSEWSTLDITFDSVLS